MTADKIKILLVEPNESIGDAITKSLQRAFDATIVMHQSSSAAVAVLHNKEVFNVVIVRNLNPATENFPEDPIATNILNALYDTSSQTQVIILGKFEHANKNIAAVLNERLRVEELNRLVLKALGLKREDFEHLKLPDFVPFSMKYFYLMNKSPCDIYIRLIKKAGDEYVKRLKHGDNFEKETLQKYEELGVSDLYIQKENYEVFMNALFLQTMESLKTNRSLEENMEVAGDSFVLSSELMKSLGITPVCVVMVNQTIYMMKSQIQKADKLSQLLKKLLDDKMSYSYRHSFLICALSYTLLPRMEWGGKEQQSIILEKICMVSYFHDIYLEDEKLVKIAHQSDFKTNDLTPREIDAVINHANRAATIVQTYPKLPQGVDIIIRQHHGVSNGVGFPEVLTTAISPLAIFFIVVEDFATNILAIDLAGAALGLAMQEALKPIKEKYQLPSYRKIVTEIENLLVKK